MATPKKLAVLAARIAEAMKEFSEILEEIASEEKPKKGKKARKPKAKAKPKPPKHPGVTYGPGEHPPPFKVDAVPPRAAADKRKTVVKKGQVCVCTNCLKPTYVANRDIHDDDFSFSAYTPVPGVEDFGESVRFENMGGNIAVDCPLCKSPMALYVVGGKPTNMEGVKVI